jgi:hypothetical protein
METSIDRINLMQKRILQGEDVSAEEMNEVISQLRSERTGSATTHREKKEAKTVEPLDLKALLLAKKGGNNA